MIDINGVKAQRVFPNKIRLHGMARIEWTVIESTHYKPTPISVLKKRNIIILSPPNYEEFLGMMASPNARTRLRAIKELSRETIQFGHRAALSEDTRQHTRNGNTIIFKA